ncbi:unnamed protein product [Symbiodinium sp. CCMP2456]|nr:unnamed protein product [Symbiodinium sp. CCMP2456]
MQSLIRCVSKTQNLMTSCTRRGLCWLSLSARTSLWKFQYCPYLRWSYACADWTSWAALRLEAAKLQRSQWLGCFRQVEAATLQSCQRPGFRQVEVTPWGRWREALWL